jgi:hypothetical protein
MLGPTGGGGLTSKIARKTNTMKNASESLLVVEGKKEDVAPATRWCRSNYPWKAPYAVTDLAMTSPTATANLDFRHDGSMTVLYGDNSVRVIKFRYATTSGGITNITQQNWDNYP